MTKVSSACNACAARKIKCNGHKPCPACVKAGFECCYSVHNKRGPKGPRPATKARINKDLQEKRGNQSQYNRIPSRANSDPTPFLRQDSANFDLIGKLEYPQPPFSLDRTHVTADDSTLVGESNITLAEITRYLQIYESRLYAIWPVVDRRAVVSQLRSDPKDPETCTLAFAICAAATARLKLDAPTPTVDSSGADSNISTLLAEQAEQHRARYNYRARATLAAALIPFFLHVYYDSNGKILTDSMLLRESITVAQLLNLDKESSYQDLSPKVQNDRRKIFWLFFVSERGCSMMRDFPISLHPSIGLPDAQLESDPSLIMAFIGLVKLFVAVSDVFSGNSGKNGQTYTCSFFARLQEELGQEPQCPSLCHEVQKADIYLTQQWLQIMLWRFSMSHVDLSMRNGEEALSLTFPARIARNAMKSIARLPFNSLVAHGKGMEQKVFEIASTLLDVINVVPASFDDIANPTARVEDSRDVFNSLGCVLGILGNGQSPYVELLQKKVDESRLPIAPISRCVKTQRAEFENASKAFEGWQESSVGSTSPSWIESPGSATVFSPVSWTAGSIL